MRVTGRTEGRALRSTQDDDTFANLDVDRSGTIDTTELISYYIAQGIDREEVVNLIGQLDTDNDGCISRKEWREGLARIREGKNRKGTGGASMISQLMLDAFIAPVQPPKAEQFDELLPLGKHRYKPCKIKHIHERAVSLKLLRERLWEHISRRCAKESWTSSNDHLATVKLEPEHVTHYDAAAYVVKPATSYHRCSLVELMSADGKGHKPKWFVSHWWGDVFYDFMRCLALVCASPNMLLTPLPFHVLCRPPMTSDHPWSLLTVHTTPCAASRAARERSAARRVRPLPLLGVRMRCQPMGSQRIDRRHAGWTERLCERLALRQGTSKRRRLPWPFMQPHMVQL